MAGSEIKTHPVWRLERWWGRYEMISFPHIYYYCQSLLSSPPDWLENISPNYNLGWRWSVWLADKITSLRTWNRKLAKFSSLMFKCQDQVGGLGSIIALIIPVATRERERERGQMWPKIHAGSHWIFNLYIKTSNLYLLSPCGCFDFTAKSY